MFVRKDLKMKNIIVLSGFMFVVSLSAGCVAVKVADTAASVAVGTTKLVYKGGKAAVNAAIPDLDNKKKKK